MLIQQWIKLHGCSNEALKNYNRWVQTMTDVKRSIHLYMALFRVLMLRVRLPPGVLQLYLVALMLGPVCARYICLCPCGCRWLDGYIQSFQIAAGVTLLTLQMHKMTKNLKKTAIQKVAMHMLLMALHLIHLWFEHADVAMMVQPFDDQVQQL